MAQMAQPVQKGEKLYEGKAKVLYATDDPALLIQYFKDDATAFNAQKKGTIENKGVLNNQISSQIFQSLEKIGIPTHYVKTLSEREMLVKKVKIIPLEFVFRNIVAGSLAKRLAIAEGTPLQAPLFEFYYKDDALGDPMVTEDHALAFGWATKDEIAQIKTLGAKINEFLKGYFATRGVTLVDGKFEFGRTVDGKLVLADEITPDGLRLWDTQTGEKLDKDRFRRDLGNIEAAYQRVHGLVVEAQS